MKDLERSNCVQEQIDPKSIVEFLKRLEGIIEPHGIVMVKNGKVICDVSYKPYDTNKPHVVNSVTKTFIGIAIGLLYDKGLIRLEDKIVDFFDDVKIDPENKGIKELTVKNVMTMSMGQITTPVLDENREWVSALLNNPMTYKPGEKFHYDSLATFLLSAVYTRITHETAAEGLQRELFIPLGIDQAYFFENRDGITIGGLGLFIPTIGLAKVGTMLINKGVYLGKRILSEKWCEMQLAKQIDNADSFPVSKHESRQGYGLQCWHCVNKGVRMSGLWGQMCLMMPEYDFVMAINARGSSSQPMLDIFNETVLKALKGEVPISDQSVLDEYIKNKEISLEKNEFVSYMKPRMNGKEVKVLNDPFGVSSFRISFEDDVCEIEVVRNGQKYSCVYGHNVLKKSISNIIDLFPPYYDSLSKPRSELLNFVEPQCYGQYHWEDEGTLLMTTLYDHEASHFLIRVHYDYEYAAFEWISKTCCTKYEHVIVHGKIEN